MKKIASLSGINGI